MWDLVVSLLSFIQIHTYIFPPCVHYFYLILRQRFFFFFFLLFFSPFTAEKPEQCLVQNGTQHLNFRNFSTFFPIFWPNLSSPSVPAWKCIISLQQRVSRWEIKEINKYSSMTQQHYEERGKKRTENLNPPKFLTATCLFIEHDVPFPILLQNLILIFKCLFLFYDISFIVLSRSTFFLSSQGKKQKCNRCYYLLRASSSASPFNSF